MDLSAGFITVMWRNYDATNDATDNPNDATNLGTNIGTNDASNNLIDKSNGTTNIETCKPNIATDSPKYCN